MGTLAGTILSWTALYALLAAGYVIVYRASRILNFAHGELMMLGAYFALFIANSIEAPVPVVIIISLALSFGVGYLLYWLIMRRMIGEPIYATIIVTIGWSIAFRGIVTIIWGARHYYLNTALGLANKAVHLPFGVILSTFDIFTIVAAVIFLTFLIMFLRMTRQGAYMRASAENPLLAAQGGINVYMIFALSWSIATIGACMAGIVYGGNTLLEPSIGFVGLLALPVALAGGMDSLIGVIPAAFIISTAQVLGVKYGGPFLSEVIPMFIMLMVLIIRPWGLFGTKEEIQRV